MMTAYLGTAISSLRNSSLCLVFSHTQYSIHSSIMQCQVHLAKFFDLIVLLAIYALFSSSMACCNAMCLGRPVEYIPHI
jgi:hypothetical protein